MVSFRLKLFSLPTTIKREVQTGNLTDGHLEAITSLVQTSELSPWLTTAQAWEELAVCLTSSGAWSRTARVRSTLALLVPITSAVVLAEPLFKSSCEVLKSSLRRSPPCCFLLSSASTHQITLKPHRGRSLSRNLSMIRSHSPHRLYRGRVSPSLIRPPYRSPWRPRL